MSPTYEQEQCMYFVHETFELEETLENINFKLCFLQWSQNQMRVLFFRILKDVSWVVALNSYNTKYYPCS